MVWRPLPIRKNLRGSGNKSHKSMDMLKQITWGYDCYYSRAMALLLRRPIATNWIISMYCMPVCQFSNSFSDRFSLPSAKVAGGYNLFPQNDRTCSPGRKICRSANCVSKSFDENRDVAGIYWTYPVRISTPVVDTSTITPRYRFACFKLAHHIRQSRPHSKPLPSSVTPVPCRSCHPESILAIISGNVPAISVTVSPDASSWIQKWDEGSVWWCGREIW